MNDSESAEITDLINRTFQQLGGRGTKAELRAHVLPQVKRHHLQQYLIGQGLDQKIGLYFRRQSSDGLPRAPEIDGHGTHVQLELLDVGEYRYAIARLMSSSYASQRQAGNLAIRCFEIHGVPIDINNPLAVTA